MSALITILKLTVAFCAGVATVFAFAPFDYYHLAVLGPAVLLLLFLDSDPRLAFRLGWAFGLGLLGVACSGCISVLISSAGLELFWP